jgi:hypothetical protein
LQELLKSESILVVVSVGGHSFWHFIGGDGADDNDGYLRETFAHYLKKLKPGHAGHVEVGNNQVRRSRAEFSERIQTVNCRPNDIPRRHQVPRDKLSDKRVVVYQQDPIA